MKGTLDYHELEILLKLIDEKMTSLPTTAQRAHQQGYQIFKMQLILEHTSPKS